MGSPDQSGGGGNTGMLFGDPNAAFGGSGLGPLAGGSGGGMDFTGSGGGMGGGFDTGPGTEFGDPLTDPFFSPVGFGPGGGGGGGQTGGGQPVDVGGAQSEDQSGRQQQQPQPSAAGGGGPAMPQSPLVTNIGDLAKRITGEQPQGPGWIAPEGGGAPAPGAPQRQQAGGLGGMIGAIGRLLSGQQGTAPGPGGAGGLNDLFRQLGGGQIGQNVLQAPSAPAPQPTPQTPEPPALPAAPTGGAAGAVPGAAPAQAATGAAPETPSEPPAGYQPGEATPTAQPSAPAAPPEPAAATETGGGAAAQPQPTPQPQPQPQPTAAPTEDPNLALTNFLAGNRPATTERAPAMGGAGQGTGGQADVDLLNQRGAHASALQGGRITSTPYGSYYYNQPFTQNLARAVRDFERENPGQKAVLGEGDRGADVQGIYRRTVSPAARPWQSRHQYGQAMDIPEGTPFNRWLHQNAGRYGMGFPVRNDPNHLQMLRGYQPGEHRSMPFRPGDQSAVPAGTQVAQAGGAPVAVGGGQALPGSRGMLPAAQAQGINWTTYTPGGGGTRRQRRMEGPDKAARPNLEGNTRVHTLDDFDAGRSRYISLAGSPQYQGMTIPVPPEQVGGRQGVLGYVHDTGGRFGPGTNKIDIPLRHGGRARPAPRSGMPRRLAMDIQRRGQPQIGQPEFDQAGALTARGGGAAAGAAAGSTQGQQIQQMDEERRRRTTAPEVRSDLLDWIMRNVA